MRSQTAAAPEILVVSAQKVLVLGDEREAAQAAQAARLRALLADAGLAAGCAALPGGCLAARGASMGEAAGCAAAVAGCIDNRRQLLERHLAGEQAISPQDTVSDAELVCHLYRRLGRTLPQKLCGSFVFVLFDPSQGRVLAAASPSASLPLLQARTAAHDLLLTTRPPEALPGGCYGLTPIPPGCLKYGWSSEPQRFADPAPPMLQQPPQQPLSPQRPQPPSPPRPQAQQRRQQLLQHSGAAAVAAAAAALAEVRTPRPAAGAAVAAAAEEQPGSSASAGTPLALADAEEGEAECAELGSSAPKKTRRGKRAGRNQKARAEAQLQQRLSFESRRASMDTSVAGSLQSVCSLGSRADEQAWWRTNTPRASLDCRACFPPRLSERTSFEARRTSMSHAAPPFVPGQPGLFSRQAVPALAGPQASALSGGFQPQRRTIAILTAARLQQPGAPSPFGSVPEAAAPGKADSAREEDSPVAAAAPAAPAPAAAAAAQPAAVTASFTTAPGAAASEPLKDARCKAATEAGGRAGVAGGSPQRPPRGPTAFRQLWKAMLPKRPSHANLQAEAEGGGGAKRRSGRSASHSSLVDLDTPSGLWDAPPRQAATAAGGGPPPLPPTPAPSRQASGDSGSGGAAEGVAGGRHQRRPSWLSRTTASIFKSKSCTALSEAGVPPPAANVPVAS